MDIEEYREFEKKWISERNRSNDHNNCSGNVKEGMSEDKRRRAADKFGENWASVISGCGDQ